MMILIKVVTENNLTYKVEIPLANESIKDFEVKFIREEKERPSVEAKEEPIQEKPSSDLNVIAPGYYSSTR